MRLTETRLRTLIRDLLLEGYDADAKALTALLEKELDDRRVASDARQLSLNNLELVTRDTRRGPNWVRWLASRFLRPSSSSVAGDSLIDSLPVVSEFFKNQQGISQRYESRQNNNQFRAAVDGAFSPAARKWKNPSDFATMSVTDLAEINRLYSHENASIDVDRKSDSWKRDKVGQFGPWALYFPSTQQHSVLIPGSDPVTQKPYVTWCTARTAGSNMFYTYTAGGTMLFYAIDEEKDPTDPDSRISIGFQDGELQDAGKDNGVTVNGANKGISMDDLRRIFGAHLEGILTAASAVVKRHGGVHPVEAEFEEAADDVNKFSRMMRGLSDTDAGVLAESILLKANLVEAVIRAAANHKSLRVKSAVAHCRAAPVDVLRELAKINDTQIQQGIAHNSSSHPDDLRALVNSKDRLTRRLALGNESTPPDAVAQRLRSLIEDDLFMRNARSSELLEIAENPNAPPDVLRAVSKLEDRVDRDQLCHTLSRNPATPADVLRSIFTPFSMSLANIAAHANAPDDVLQKILNYVTRTKGFFAHHTAKALVSNPKTPTGMLEDFLTHSGASDDIMQLARDNLARRGSTVDESRRLARRIVAELKRR